MTVNIKKGVNNVKCKKHTVNRGQMKWGRGDIHRTYDVTKKSVRATILVVEKQYVLHILSVCL